MAMTENDQQEPSAPGTRSTERKRKADVLGRVSQSCKTQGRGAESGWTKCPLCDANSSKRFALGRGIAAHLHAVHTPWNPGKAERRKRRRLWARRQAEAKRTLSDGKVNITDESSTIGRDVGPLERWEPTSEEVEAWEQEVLNIVAKLETECRDQEVGVDRSGKTRKSYADSLPPFLSHASSGNMEGLQEIVSKVSHSKDDLRELLETRDRNGSTAEHWAAGGGHVKTLMYLHKLQQSCFQSTTTTATLKKRVRRRDGKTSLHYAARNGKVDCIRYLLDSSEGTRHQVDEPSGDQTTPLHLAIYGGHPSAVQLLIERYGADPLKRNDWGCGSAHWLGMTKSQNEQDTAKLCHILQQSYVSFSDIQKQGHSILHKAAKTQNRFLLEWAAQNLSQEEKRIAGQPDVGGHKPSDIWDSVNGQAKVSQWMREQEMW